MTEKKVPERRCIGCMTSRPKQELIRIVADENGLHIDPSGKMPGRGAYLCRSEECEIRNKHRIAGAESPGFEGQSQSIRPIGAGKAMLYTHILRQLPFQLPNLRAHDVGATRDGLENGMAHFLPEDLILLLKISELHSFAVARPMNEASN